MKKTTIAMLSGIIIVMIASYYGFFLHNELDSYISEKSVCEEGIKKDMNDPFTAQFTYEKAFDVDGFAHFTGYVYAKNSFNATIKKSFICKVKIGSIVADTAMILDTFDPNK